jgi:hypothetical protein
MDISQIISTADFLEFVAELSEVETERTLDEYLRALWGLIQKHSNERPAYSMLARLLFEAFTSKPVQFDSDWLKFTRPPISGEVKESFEYLKQVILCQIADLHRMKAIEITPIEKYSGFTSPTGNTWHNFDPSDYLEAASNGFRAHVRRDSKVYWSVFPHTFESTECDWGDLAEILCLGQIYE